ncbi:hypothetical protein HIM_02939 [Hirsutella minnesotensis 3608]|nr:hypothetical protein HIM_02939 [Hirsutella minnesotensis 3608]
MRVSWSLVAHWVTLISLAGDGRSAPSDEGKLAGNLEKLNLGEGSSASTTMLELSEERPASVWHFSHKSLDGINNERGLWSEWRGKKASDYTPEQRKQSSSLYHHAHGKGKGFSSYTRVYLHLQDAVRAGVDPNAPNKGYLFKLAANSSIDNETQRLEDLEARIRKDKCKWIADRHASLRGDLPKKMAEFLSGEALEFNDAFISELSIAMRSPLPSQEAIAATSTMPPADSDRWTFSFEPKESVDYLSDKREGRKRRSSDSDRYDPNLRRIQYEKYHEPEIKRFIKFLRDDLIVPIKEEEIRSRIQSTAQLEQR